VPLSVVEAIMTLPRVRFIGLVCGVLVTQLLTADASAQRYKQSRPRKPATTNTQAQNQQDQQPTAQAQTQQQSTQQGSQQGQSSQQSQTQRRSTAQRKPAQQTRPRPQAQPQRRTTSQLPTRRQPTTIRQAQRQPATKTQRRQMPPQRQAKRPATTRSTRTARNSTQAPKLTQPQVVEKADPETKAAFLKLMGANWIWSPAYVKDEVPVGECYFRKTFSLRQAEFGEVHIACDNQYELFVNGRLAGQGSDWRKMNVHDVVKFLLPGTNVVAVKATNTDAGAAGLVARVVIKERGGTYESYSTDATWRTSVKAPADWMQSRIRDSEWLHARVYGPLGGVLPWGDEIVVADEGSRFLIDPEFVIERMVTNEQVGSLIAMTFNAAGDILASREGGPLLLIRRKEKQGAFDTFEPFCQEVRNVQGILSVGNRVFAVGDGPAGGALYQMVDKDADGKSDELTALVRFRGVIGEHGPHTVRLGPDGLLYLLSGNFAHVDAPHHPRSPYLTVYEGDLVQPRYEDPQGHAVGVPAPGGVIYRTDTSGSFVEMVAGGFRNPYDFAFNDDGELFTNDADMEWDIGAPWYRPTRICHAPLGGEFGWRSGWAKSPDYHIDTLPAMLDIGPGSPTGVVFYDHTAFPERLQNTLFVGDWAMGQIHAVKLERSGATYKAKMATFVKGRPLNVTGLDVGPDGALYFCTGGRGTDGGIYRVRWTGNAAAATIQFGQGIKEALHQPQIHSDWARMQIAAVKRKMGDRWQSELEQVLADRNEPARDRLRALDVMTYFGPPPSAKLLLDLSQQSDPAMRVRVARLMGNRPDEEFTERLTALLADDDAWVRRVACEAVAHRDDAVPTSALIDLLADRDRFVAFAARRALEKRAAAEWQEQVLTSNDPRTFLQGATGLLVAHPSPEIARQIVTRCQEMMRGEVQEQGMKRGQLSDPAFLDLLRVVQLALVRGPIPAADVPSLSQQMMREYPTRHAMMNRELVRLLAYLQPPEAAHGFAQQLESDIPDVEKLQIAAYAPRITQGWETADKLIMLSYYEKVRGIKGGHSLGGYIENFARDFFATLTTEERRQLIATGENFPTSTLSVLAKLPGNPSPELLADIRALDTRLEGMAGEPAARLRVGIVAVLGGSGEAESFEYLRNLYLNDPQRRAPVAMSLTQHPEGDNWPILVDSLRTVEGEPAQTVLTALARVDRRPDTSEPFRNTILLGLRLQAAGGALATGLLEKWLGHAPYGPDTPLPDQLVAWQTWYANTFPDELPAELPKESQPNKWSYEELASYLESPEGKSGSPSRGEKVFHSAQCVNCHRFNGRGEGIGPDLTTVAQRFQRKEILESIVHPNQVVSDQYASQIVIAGGKTYTGIVARDPDGSMTVLQSDSQKVELAADDIEDVRASKTSAMPEGLLNTLTLEQVADLFAFLTKSPEPNVAGRGTAGTR
jgi:putative heme-binding domain-containing protein